MKMVLDKKLGLKPNFYQGEDLDKKPVDVGVTHDSAQLLNTTNNIQALAHYDSGRSADFLNLKVPTNLLERIFLLLQGQRSSSLGGLTAC